MEQNRRVYRNYKNVSSYLENLMRLLLFRLRCGIESDDIYSDYVNSRCEKRTTKKMGEKIISGQKTKSRNDPKLKNRRL